MTISQIVFYSRGTKPKQLAQNEAMARIRRNNEMQARWTDNRMKEWFGGV